MEKLPAPIWVEMKQLVKNSILKDRAVELTADEVYQILGLGVTNTIKPCLINLIT